MNNVVTRWLFSAILVLLVACQSAPFSRDENPQTAVNQALLQIQRQAMADITPPNAEEAALIGNALLDLAISNDSRLFPLILLLKEGRLELLALDAARFSANPEGQKSAQGQQSAQTAKLVSAAIRAYLDPIKAQSELIQDKNAPTMSPAAHQLLSLVQARLAMPANQSLMLRKALLGAESVQNIPEQIKLLNQLIALNAPKGSASRPEDMRDGRALTFYLNRLLALEPQNSAENLLRLEWLAQLYGQQNDKNLADGTLRQALTLAERTNNVNAVNRLQRQLGIIPINPEWVQVRDAHLARIADINRAMSLVPESANADNFLVLADLYTQLGQTAHAESATNQALTDARREKNTLAEINAIVSLGDLARLHSDLRRAQTQYSLANNLLSLVNEKKPELFTAINSKLASMLFFQGNIPAALDQLQTAQNALPSNMPILSARLQAEKWVMQALQSKQFNTQASEWTLALAVLRNAPNASNASSASSAPHLEEIQALSGVVYAGLGQHREAVTAFEQAINGAQSGGRFFRASLWMTNRALSLQRLQQSDLALAQLKTAQSIMNTLQSDMIDSVNRLIEVLDKDGPAGG